jgi:thioredoxin-related protein
LKYILILLLAVTQFVHAETRDPETYFFNQTLGDFSDELAQAKAAGKKGILIMFEQDDCPFCARMKATVLNQSEVQNFYQKNFSIFHVDTEGDIEIHDMAGKAMSEKDFAFKVNRVRATPVFIFYNLEGKPVVRYTGPTSGVGEFMLLGQYAVDKKYYEESFTRYKLNNKK